MNSQPDAYPIKSARLLAAAARDQYAAAAAPHLRALIDPTSNQRQRDRAAFALDRLDRAYAAEAPAANDLDADGWPVIRWSTEP